MEYLNLLNDQILKLENSGKKRTASIVNRVFLKLAQEEMYDRSRDFFDYTPTQKKPLTGAGEEWMEEAFKGVTPAQNTQWYLFPYKDFWHAEVLDYNDWDLNEFNGKPNIKKTQYPAYMPAEEVIAELKVDNPNVHFDYFDSFAAWQKEFLDGEGIFPNFGMPN